MSETVDANILVYASSGSDPLHAEASRLIEKIAAGPNIFYLFWPVALGYLRIVTHPGILRRPLSFAEASANIAELVALPHVRAPGETDNFWRMFLSVAGGQERGNSIPDAHIAALMREHGVATIYTRDRDFRRFDGINAVDPFN
ncbi:MAG TPA: TA system VapC family ribonuclease toxin [Chloroflexota bacterium]|nr:TA system VapC family ribonuclease toxin [Chloroflexota bacterium]